MQIRIKLMGALKDLSPDGNTLKLPDGATIEDALLELNIAAKVHAVSLNGTFERDRSKPLSPDDQLTVLPPVSGG